MKTLFSNRKYIYVFIEGNYPASGEITLKEILDDKIDFEYIYSIRENIDALLDLKEGEKMALKFNRDYKDSDGFIKRIKP